MERTRTAQSGGREQREELERLQAELAQVRRATVAERERQPRELEALRGEVLSAQGLLDATAARCAQLEHDLRAQQQQLEGLRARLVAKQREDEVLARGAALRDVVFVPTDDEAAWLTYRAERPDGTPAPQAEYESVRQRVEGWLTHASGSPGAPRRRRLTWVELVMFIILVALLFSLLGKGL